MTPTFDRIVNNEAGLGIGATANRHRIAGRSSPAGAVYVPMSKRSASIAIPDAVKYAFND